MTNIKTICDLITTNFNYEKDSYDLKIKDNDLIIIINNKKYELHYDTINTLKIDLEQIIATEESFDIKYKIFTKIINDLQIINNLPFVEWYNNLLTNKPFVLTTDLFSKKHLNVTTNTYWQEDDCDIFIFKKHFDDQIIQILNDFTFKQLIVDINLTKHYRLTYVLDLARIKVYHEIYDIQTHSLKTTHDKIIKILTNLINEFYSHINSHLTNLKLDVILQLIKLNYGLKYTDNYATKKAENWLVMFNRVDMLANNLFYSGFMPSQNEAQIPIVFEYNNQTFEDEGFSIVSYNQYSLKIAYKTLDEWIEYYINYNKTNGNAVDLKTALKNYQFTDNDNVFNIPNIVAYHETNCLTWFYEVPTNLLVKWRKNQQLNTLHKLNKNIMNAKLVSDGILVEIRGIEMCGKDIVSLYEFVKNWIEKQKIALN